MWWKGVGYVADMCMHKLNYQLAVPQEYKSVGYMKVCSYIKNGCFRIEPYRMPMHLLIYTFNEAVKLLLHMYMVKSCNFAMWICAVNITT